MVSSLLNLRKRALASPPPSPLTSSNPARPSPAMSRLSRLGGLTSRRTVDSLTIPTTMTDSAAADDDLHASPSSNRSLGASFRPLKQIRRQSRSFSSAFTALFPPSSPCPSTPASGTATPQSSHSPASPLAPFNSVRPRLISEKRRKAGGGRRGKQREEDGIKRRISYPLLSRASCDQPDRVVVRESWGARDETQKAPRPRTLGHLVPLPIPSNYEPCTDQSESPVVPDWTATTTTTTTSVPRVSARASLATSTQAVHHDAHYDDLAGKGDSASRFSAATTRESMYSIAATDPSPVWVKFPATMTVTATAEAPAVAPFDVFAGGEPTDLAFSPSLSLDVQSGMGEHRDEMMTAPSPSRDSHHHEQATSTKVFAPASAQTTLTWTSKDSSTTSMLHSTRTPDAQRRLPESRMMYPHRLLTPPPTPHLGPVRSRLHTPENLEISPPKYAGLFFAHSAHTVNDATGGESTRDSLLSLTLAELSDEMAHIRRRAHSTKSSDSDSDSNMSSLSPSSLQTSLFPLPTYSHDGPPSFLDLHSHSSQGSLTSEIFETLPTTTTTTTTPPPHRQIHAPQPPQRQQRLLRRISQRLCHARLPPSSQPFPTTPTRPPRQENEDSPDKSPSLESLLQTPTRTSFVHRLARQSLHFFTR